MSADQQRPSGPPAVVPVAPAADATGPRPQPAAEFIHLADRGFPTKATLDRALAGCPSVRSVLVVHRTGRPVSWVPGRDHWWHEALGEAVRLGTLDT